METLLASLGIQEQEMPPSLMRGLCGYLQNNTSFYFDADETYRLKYKLYIYILDANMLFCVNLVAVWQRNTLCTHVTNNIYIYKLSNILVCLLMVES